MSDIKIIGLHDGFYPPLLKETQSPPKKIYFNGCIPSVDDILVAVVGTRKATRDGLAIAKRIGQELAEAGVVVVSGLALGIDGAAHKGAILGGGKTVAVLAGGLDNIHPRTHFSIAQEILKDGGCIMSEHGPGVPSLPHYFLERNRIISGLSLAVVVIEAPMRSGSLSTARHALDQGREVFVVPGPAGSFNYAGSHRFIREGARLVTSVGEILDDLEFDMIKNKDSSRPTRDNVEEDRIIEVLFLTGALSVNRLAEKIGMKLSILNSSLGNLVLDGIVEESGNEFKLKNL